jgi:hypothetical protein
MVSISVVCAKSFLSSFYTFTETKYSQPSLYEDSRYEISLMISGATAHTGPWPPFTGFMIVCSSTMWGYQLHDRPILDILIQSSETSSSNYQRLSWRSRGNTGKKWPLNFADETCRARRVLLHAVNLRHETDDFTSPRRKACYGFYHP